MRMKRTKSGKTPLSAQIKKKHEKETLKNEDEKYDGVNQIVSTGSTLLDLAISGGRFPEGGIPLGILVEIFGPSGTGKTVLLSQIAGNVQRMGGEVMFHDPEARLDKQFASMFGLDIPNVNYTIPDTVPQVFASIRKWISDNKNETLERPFVVCADSLAALSTDMEMTKDEGDKMGMRRAKEFSEELRKTCRAITQQNILVVGSNQIRQNLDAGPWGQKYKSPGGEAIGFYSSLRLRCMNPQKIKIKRVYRGQDYERIVGIQVSIDVFKSSVWSPFRSAELFIIYNYGIDDIRGNLVFLKNATRDSVYSIGDRKLGRAIGKAIREVETEGLESELKAKTIEVWNEIEKEFEEPRRPREW